MILARARVVLAGSLLAALFGRAGYAQDVLCAPLMRLLANPPAGFVERRAGPDGDQRWTATPVAAAAVCGVWESRAGDADSIRCTINDRANPASVTAFYDGEVAGIDRCLATQPVLGKWERTTSPVSVEGLRGTETIWVRDTDALRFKISLADYLRTATNSSYNSFSVEYLKY